MAKAKALSTFRMGQALIRTGAVFEAEPDYIRALARNGLAEFYAERPVTDEADEFGDLYEDAPGSDETAEGENMDTAAARARQNSGRKSKK